ncbi:MAG TPA: class I SAM-dependent methyltransferase [Thermoleophilaceae bacterium]|nr:class I SAM-dependent methyltransferase [Thermoleophilaceae bacterium]
MSAQRAGARRPGAQTVAGTPAPPFDPAVGWHDVECGGYAADLPLWRELAAAWGGPVLELGAGTGRVALELAAAGHEVTALDCDPALVAECAARARERGLRVDAVCADACSFAIGRRFPLVVAPMQVVQLLEGTAARATMLARVRDHLEHGGLFAPALADPFAGLAAADSLPPLPDTGERQGWALASTPVVVREEASREGDRIVAIDRLRRADAPHGASVESAATIRLSVFPSDKLADSATAHGFRRLPDRTVPETHAYVGSTVLVLEAV